MLVHIGGFWMKYSQVTRGDASDIIRSDFRALFEPLCSFGDDLFGDAIRLALGCMNAQTGSHYTVMKFVAIKTFTRPSATIFDNYCSCHRFKPRLHRVDHLSLG